MKVRLFAGALLVLGILAGCGRGESASDRNVAQFRETLSRVQADHDRFDQRLSAVEIAMADERAANPPVARASSPAKTPDLRVVHLDPGGEPMESAADDPEDTTPRPAIKVAGVVPAPRNPRGKSVAGRAEPRIEQTNMPEDDADPSRLVRPSALDPEAKRSYDAALAMVNAKQYPQALEAFAAFLVKWPDHPNADNAMYWRGECYFAQGDFNRAAEQFDGLIARFPLGNKVPDALLKLGSCHDKLGNSQKARAAYDKLSHDFPRSEAARRIPGPAGSGPKGPKESK